MATQAIQPKPAAGQIWKRRRDGLLIRIHNLRGGIEARPWLNFGTEYRAARAQQYDTVQFIRLFEFVREGTGQHK